MNDLLNGQLFDFHKLKENNHVILPIENLNPQNPIVYKAKKFACKSLKTAQSGIRVIYAYFPIEDRIELIEIYFKGDQVNENKERIKNFYLNK